MKRVLVGLSGGVDSAVAAYLLKQEGHDVVGVMLRTWMSDDGQESRCCEIDDAKAIADAIGIPFHPFNCTGVFNDKVIQPFMEQYLQGLTPNPCIFCNRYVKWERLMYYMKVLKGDYIATGHYAKVVKLGNGRYTVRNAEHIEKDQTYMLYRLTQEELAATLMPLGKYSKDEVRAIAAKAGIPVADKPDSQEICFIPDDDHAGFIRSNYPGKIPGEGNFVDTKGNVLGTHKGVMCYTVGQRKGLGIALGKPAYVCRIDTEKNEVVIGDIDDIMSDTVVCELPNFLSMEAPLPGEEFRCRARIRYHHEPAEAVACMTDEGKLRIKFSTPVKGAAPGQSAVMYDDEGNVIGGGVICKERQNEL